MSSNMDGEASSSHLAPGSGSGTKLTTQQSLAVTSHRTPTKFFNPTHISFHDIHSGQHAGNWTSRKARKGRYQPKSNKVHYTPSTQGGRGRGGEEGKVESLVSARIKREESKLKPGLKADISFWLAITFTFGSVIWVINGYLVWFPILRPELDTNTVLYTAAAFAFIGGTVFEVGSYLMVIEALDRGRESNFGTALGKLLHHHRTIPSGATPVSTEKLFRSVGSSPDRSGAGRTSTASSDTYAAGAGDSESSGGAKGFVWWGKPLWHDMGYVAALVQLFAATIFWISTITGLPGVIPGYAEGEGSKAIIDVFFWTPQVIGGTGFIISALILMIEVQKKWYLPKLLDIGWWVGFWNLIGAIGFTLCGALGYSSSSKAEYQSALSTFWGSWAFLLGSFAQVYETIWREPASSPSPSTTRGDKGANGDFRSWSRRG